MAHRRHRLRRLILDETGQAELEAPKRSASSSKPGTIEKKETPAYALSATRRHQKKTTDLIPKRAIPYAMVVLLLVNAIGILNLSASLAAKWSDTISAEAMGALTLSGRSSISGWFSSFLLILTGLASLQIYALRQHRNDDYRGTYRLWLWLAGLFVLASMNYVVDFGAVASIVGNLCFKDWVMSAGSSLWWLLALKIVALSVLVIRGLLEVRASRSATVMVVVVWVAYSASIVMQIPQVRNLSVMHYETVYGNCHLVGTTFVLLSVLTYARFVFLRANGLIQIAAKISKPVVETEGSTKTASTATKKSIRLTSPAAKKPREIEESPRVALKTAAQGSTGRNGLTSPLAAKMQAMGSSEDPVVAGMAGEEAAEILQLRDKQVLSKAERRRLKKLQKRQHQRRAA